jgi:hypothetical protein
MPRAEKVARGMKLYFKKMLTSVRAPATKDIAKWETASGLTYSAAGLISLEFSRGSLRICRLATSVASMWRL